MDSKKASTFNLTPAFPKHFSVSSINSIDTFLETVPDSEIGVQFESVESLTPTYSLTFKRIRFDNPEAERLNIAIDPPMRPGDTLNYRWVAKSGASTIVTSPEPSKKLGLTHGYIFWDIIAPLKHLEIDVVIPCDENLPLPHAWFDVWRIGRWRSTQTQTAYRAYLKDNPNSVFWSTEMKSPDKLTSSLRIDYPWLAMRYVLAW